MLLIFLKFYFLNFRVQIKKQNEENEILRLFCLQVTAEELPLEGALRFVILPSKGCHANGNIALLKICELVKNNQKHPTMRR